MTVDRSAVVEKLRAVYLRVKDDPVDASRVTEQASLATDLGIDSLDLLEMRFDVDTAFGVKMSDADVSRMKTIGDVVDIILARV